ncbi:MAG: ATP-binding protein [Deltaproteobacteria bacterium]|nr:ATP-binding protein [Deltaproteobacteria bacterium]
MNDQTIKALLVEDDPDQAELLQKMLTPSTRFAVTYVQRLSDAVQHLNKERFDVVLLDLMLPDSQGLDTLDKAHEQALNVPIVVISYLKDEAVALEAVCKGAQDYLVKGQLDGQMLSRTIRYAIERKRAELALATTAAAERQKALELQDAFKKLDVAHQDLAMIHAITAAVSNSLDLDQVLEKALDTVLEVTGRDAGYIRLKDPVTGDLEFVAHRGISEAYVETLLHGRTPGGKSDQVFASGDPLIINDPQGTILKEETRREGFCCLGWFPLKAQGKVVGILNVSTTQPIPFESREVALLQAIGNVIGVALGNSQLYEQTKKQSVQLEKEVGERKQAEESLREAHKQLEIRVQERTRELAETNAALKTEITERKRAEEMKDKFFSSVSHDLGSPLMVMQGYLELLLDGFYGELPKGAVKPMDSLARTTNSMGDLVKSILEIGKIQSGRYVFSIESLDLKDLVSEILEEVLSLAEAKGLTLSKEFSQDSFPMETDRSGLRRILYNLMGNAIKFTEHGGVKISVNSMAGGVGSPAGVVGIRVEDTGCGIEAYQLGKIFDEFYQVDGSGSNTAPGTGLGLSICQRLVKLLGGEITVESEVGRGTVFSVTLPQKIGN